MTEPHRSLARGLARLTSIALDSPTAQPVRQAYGRLATNVPLVLAPVRIETRVLDGKPDRLAIRVYPDQLHLDQHDPALSPAERRLGAEYWVAQRAFTSTTERLAVWESLVALLGAHRAAYVATATEDGDRGGREAADGEGDRGRDEGRVRLLPSRWLALGFVNGEEVFAVVGAPIPADLALRIDEAGDRAWLTDYPTALELGMALEVELAGAAGGFLAASNELIVVGVRTGVDPARAAGELADTLQHHLWTGGLGIAAPGQTTNALTGPTGETAAVAPVPVPPPVLPTPPAREGPVIGPGSKVPTDGARLAQALGLPDEALLATLEHGADDHVRGGGQMNQVVWPVTMGELLVSLLAGTDGHHAFPDIDPDVARSFFVDHVRGGGPLPALRVRDQPYGFLPVKLLDAASFGSDHRGDLLRLLTGLDRHWNEASDLVARLDGTGARVGDADVAFVELMSSQPDPWSFAVRHLDVRQEIEGWEALLLLFGLVLPTFGLVTYHTVLTALLLDNVQPYDSWIEKVEPLLDPVENYATSFLHRQAVAALRAELLAATQPTAPEDLPTGPFLEVDIDWEVCMGICDALLELIDLHDARMFPLMSRSGEVSGVFPDTHDPAIGFGVYDGEAPGWSEGWPLVESAGAPPDQQAGSYLAALADLARAGATVTDTPGFSDPVVAEPLLAQLARQAVNRALGGSGSPTVLAGALDGLAGRDPAQLTLLLRQSLGTVSYRLDAWTTAVAAADLDAMRAGGAEGCHLGGYGWVEDLERGAATESEGFVHAPSLTHAITASILRSGWKAHGDDEASSALAVDLSSARVRAATELLDGVRQGVSLGELMGHRFERTVHDAGLDVWIDPCRRAVLDATGRAGEAVLGPVDGLLLAALWDHGTPGNALELAIGALTEIGAALGDLDAAIDAVVDVTTAEAVHQIVQGNLDRAAATFDAVASGDVAPPELDIARTPRRSRGVTHRLAVLVDGPDADPTSVATAPAVLAAVAPAVDRLVTDLLPAPELVTATVRWQGAVRTVSLADLDVAGLDAVFLVGSDGDPSALVHRLRLTGGRLLAATGDLDAIEVDLGGDGIVTMDEWLAVAVTVRRLLATSRPIGAGDLDPEGAEPTPTEDRDRPVADALVARLGAARTALAAVLDRGADPADLGAPLAELARLHVRSALAPLVDDDVSWQRTAAAATAEAGQRLARLAREDGLDGHGRIELALGVRLPLPHAVARPTVLAAAAQHPPSIVDVDAAVPGWLQRLRRTRPSVALFEDVCAAAVVLDTAVPAFSVVQVPADPAGHWVAEAVPAQSTMHLVLAATATTPELGAAVTGLLVDDWVEAIPLADVDSGLAFHFDAPGAEAPQAVLIAVPPEGADGWTARKVAATVRTTLALARRRAPGPTELAAAMAGDQAAPGHYLPATHLPEPVRFPAGAPT